MMLFMQIAQQGLEPLGLRNARARATDYSAQGASYT